MGAIQLVEPLDHATDLAAPLILSLWFFNPPIFVVHGFNIRIAIGPDTQFAEARRLEFVFDPKHFRNRRFDI